MGSCWICPSSCVKGNIGQGSLYQQCKGWLNVSLHTKVIITKKKVREISVNESLTMSLRQVKKVPGR
ncbi:hypothetical protein Gotri_015030 [Gossypium trilobum]|uniref:Uncharacterized protein n=1 Tax=Gossypium trilobum TaxID=34281 RepID=A0A7J9DYU3_9ROSI|nr:hypothetical protein [Gossypium trilobum]